MRNFLLVILIILLQVSIASADGIQFTDLSFRRAITKAKDENKLVFVDAYATWCAPCRMMDSEVFKQVEVGTYYNQNFINLKIDMEAGIGKTLASQFDVRSYPSFLFINGDGELVHKATGYQSVKSFLNQGRAAKNGIVDMDLEMRFAEGERNLPFMLDYITSQLNRSSWKRVEKVIRATIADHKEDWSNPYIIGLLLYLQDQPDTEVGRYLLENHVEVDEIVGAHTYMSNMQFRFLEMAGTDPQNKQKDWPKPEVMANLYREYASKMANRFMSHYEMVYAIRTSDLGIIENIYDSYLNKYGSDAFTEYINFATFLYEQSDEIKVLELARTYAGKGISMNRKSISAYMTLSAIYQKMGKLELAEKAKAKGKSLAVEQGMNVGN